MFSTNASRMDNNNNNSNRSELPKTTRWLVLFFSCFVSFGSYFCYDIPKILRSDMKIQFQFLQSTDFDAFYSLTYSIYWVPNIVIPLISGYVLYHYDKHVAVMTFSLLVLAGLMVQALGCQLLSSSLFLFGRLVFALGAESLIIGTQTLLTLWFMHSELAFALALNLSLCRLGNLASASWISALATELFDKDNSNNSNNNSYNNNNNSGVVAGVFWIGSLVCALSSLFCFALLYTDRTCGERKSLELYRGGGCLDADEEWGGELEQLKQEELGNDSSWCGEESVGRSSSSSRSGSGSIGGGRRWGGDRYGYGSVELNHLHHHAAATATAATATAASAIDHDSIDDDDDNYAVCYNRDKDGTRRPGLGYQSRGRTGPIGAVKTPTHGPSSPSSSSSYSWHLSYRAWLLCATGFCVYSSVLPFATMADVFVLERYFPSAVEAGPTTHAHDIATAAELQLLPFMVAALLTPLLGFALDFLGQRTLFIVLAPLCLTIAHLLFLSELFGPVVPLILLGVAYSIFASVVWPCLPLVSERHALYAPAFGILTSCQNLAMCLVPAVIDAVFLNSSSNSSSRKSTGDASTGALWVFAACSTVGVLLGIVLWLDDERNHASRLRTCTTYNCCRGEGTREGKHTSNSLCGEVIKSTENDSVELRQRQQQQQRQHYRPPHFDDADLEIWNAMIAADSTERTALLGGSELPHPQQQPSLILSRPPFSQPKLSSHRPGSIPIGESTGGTDGYGDNDVSGIAMRRSLAMSNLGKFHTGSVGGVGSGAGGAIGGGALNLAEFHSSSFDISGALGISPPEPSSAGSNSSGSGSGGGGSGMGLGLGLSLVSGVPLSILLSPPSPTHLTDALYAPYEDDDRCHHRDPEHEHHSQYYHDNAYHRHYSSLFDSSNSVSRVPPDSSSSSSSSSSESPSPSPTPIVTPTVTPTPNECDENAMVSGPGTGGGNRIANSAVSSNSSSGIGIGIGGGLGGMGANGLGVGIVYGGIHNNSNSNTQLPLQGQGYVQGHIQRGQGQKARKKGLRDGFDGDGDGNGDSAAGGARINYAATPVGGWSFAEMYRRFSQSGEDGENNDSSNNDNNNSSSNSNNNLDMETTTTTAPTVETEEEMDIGLGHGKRGVPLPPPLSQGGIAVAAAGVFVSPPPATGRPDRRFISPPLPPPPPPPRAASYSGGDGASHMHNYLMHTPSPVRSSSDGETSHNHQQHQNPHSQSWLESFLESISPATGIGAGSSGAGSSQSSRRKPPQRYYTFEPSAQSSQLLTDGDTTNMLKQAMLRAATRGVTYDDQGYGHRPTVRSDNDNDNDDDLSRPRTRSRSRSGSSSSSAETGGAGAGAGAGALTSPPCSLAATVAETAGLESQPQPPPHDNTPLSSPPPPPALTSSDLIQLWSNIPNPTNTNTNTAATTAIKQQQGTLPLTLTPLTPNANSTTTATATTNPAAECATIELTVDEFTRVRRKLVADGFVEKVIVPPGHRNNKLLSQPHGPRLKRGLSLNF